MKKLIFLAAMLSLYCIQHTSAQNDRIVANPMDLSYRFQYGKPSYREAADPVCEYFNGKYYLFASRSGGYWSSPDLAKWTHIPSKTIGTIENYAPTILLLDNAMYYLASGEPVRIYKNTNPDKDTWELIDTQFRFPMAGNTDPAFFLDDDGRVYLYWGCSDKEPIVGIEVDPKNGFKTIGEAAVLIKHQSELYGAEEAVGNVVGHLVSEGMLERNERLTATPFGKRTSDLYIDPESAVILRDSLHKMNDDTPELAILHAVASTPDVIGLYPKKADREILEDLIDRYRGYMLTDVPDGHTEYEFFLSDLKTAYLMQRWIDETEEDVITDELGIGPGDIRARVDSVEWLLHAMNELSVIFRPECTARLRPLLTRIRYGIRDELRELVSFRGVGRVRARTLYNAGIKGRKDVADADDNILISKVGAALARSLKEQTGYPYSEKQDHNERERFESATSAEIGRQSNIFDF